jgi:hypothetical protein
MGVLCNNAERASGCKTDLPCVTAGKEEGRSDTKAIHVASFVATQ